MLGDVGEDFFVALTVSDGRIVALQGDYAEDFVALPQRCSQPVDAVRTERLDFAFLFERANLFEVGQHGLPLAKYVFRKPLAEFASSRRGIALVDKIRK